MYTCILKPMCVNEISPHTCQNGYHQKTTNSKCWWECGEKGTLVPYWWDCKLVQPLWKIVWRVLKKLKIKVSYNPAIPVPVLFLRKRKTLTRKDMWTSMFLCMCTGIYCPAQGMLAVFHNNFKWSITFKNYESLYTWNLHNSVSKLCLCGVCVHF